MAETDFVATPGSIKLFEKILQNLLATVNTQPAQIIRRLFVSSNKFGIQGWTQVTENFNNPKPLIYSDAWFF